MHNQVRQNFFQKTASSYLWSVFTKWEICALYECSVYVRPTNVHHTNVHPTVKMNENNKFVHAIGVKLNATRNLSRNIKKFEEKK